VTKAPAARGLFVSYRPFLQDAPGGVQACTREYIEVLEAAGLQLAFAAFDGDRRLSTRLLRQANSSPYLRPFEPALVTQIRAAVDQAPPDFVFLNQVALSPLASMVRPWLPPACRIVVLSHGMEITDLVHLVRLRARLPLSGRVRPWASALLGSVLAAEASLRGDVDLIVNLSSFDAASEAWINGTRTDWLPRTITNRPLAEWSPSAGGFGYVGTLDHGPNLEGLVQVLDAMGPAAGERVRVVGGPEAIGRWLAQRYPAVDYLGPLSAPDLEREATTWTAFLHPIFCIARGCSTKLAQAIGWRIPIVTTPAGRRGYLWSQGALIEASDPLDFVARMRSLDNPTAVDAAQRQTALVAETSPTLAEVGFRMAALLGLEPGVDEDEDRNRSRSRQAAPA
jgi:hypothetical protein